MKVTFPGVAHPLAGSVVGDDAVLDTEAGRKERCPARKARRVGNIDVGESSALRRDPIDVRGGGTVVAVAAQVIGAQRVDVDLENAHQDTPCLYWFGGFVWAQGSGSGHSVPLSVRRVRLDSGVRVRDTSCLYLVAGSDRRLRIGADETVNRKYGVIEPKFDSGDGGEGVGAVKPKGLPALTW